MYRVLIVEDDAIIRDMLVQMMRQEGYDTYEAEDGKEALKIVDSRKPNLVITDLLMPEKEGLELIQEVRKKDKKIKIVAISGGSRLIDADQSLKTAQLIGADRVCKKPLNRTKFIQDMRELIETTD
jgi:CheY-like chemotaxis protein